jgi:hypothetical protein
MAQAERAQQIEIYPDADVSKEHQKILTWFSDSVNSIPETLYRDQSLEDYQFYAGDQDTQSVLDKLAAEDRPNPVFNEVKPKIDMLVGLAAQSPNTAMVVPVTQEDEVLTELMNGTLKHYQKKLKIQRKQTKCFEHTCKGGRSLMWFWIDKSNPFQPKIKSKRWRSDQFYLDPNASSLDLGPDGDHRFIFLEQWLTEEELKILAPNFPTEVLKNAPAKPDGPYFWNEAKDLYRVIECWYYKYEEVFWFVNPISGVLEGLTAEEYKQFKEVVSQGIPLDSDGNEVFAMSAQQIKEWEAEAVTRSYRKAPFYRIFSDQYVIEEGRSTLNWAGIPGVLFGAYKDDDNNTWFSAVTMMKDPQRALNTIRRQLIHLLQTLPKGILIHEQGVILDIERYEQSSSEPNFHLEVQRGGIDKVKFEQQPTISPVYQMLDQVFHQSMKNTGGIHDDLMGVETSSREATSTIHARQQTGYAVLYILFDNFRESRFQAARLLLSLIQQFVREPEVIRITGQTGLQLLQINSQLNPQVQGFNDISALEFDVEVDEVAETASMRIYIANVLGEFAHNNPGTIPPDILLDYLNVPFSVKQRVTAYWEEVRAQELRLKERELEIEEMKVKATANRSKGE